MPADLILPASIPRPSSEGFNIEAGLLVLPKRHHHRDQEYDEHGFNVLLSMQRQHFWYRGRHRLLLGVLREVLSMSVFQAQAPSAIDLGGGCGGWLEYLHVNEPGMFTELALGDSSFRALSLAEGVVASFAPRFHVDLLDLPWEGAWDVVFLLDVLEHIPEHEEVLCQVRKILRPGGFPWRQLDFPLNDN